ncbi:MAG: AAA family ATPase [Nanoarchaeota archaeon]
MAENKLSIAIAGGQCTGKSVTSAALFAHLKIHGLDYDFISEEHRKLISEFGDYRSSFDRFYMWRQQEREELRSTARNGFITDAPLFHFYASAKMYASEPRDNLAVRELFRMCLEINDRYQLIVIAEDPAELPYKTDSCRHAGREKAFKKHQIVRSFVEHHYPEKLLLVRGTLDKRILQIEDELKRRGSEFKELPYK